MFNEDDFDKMMEGSPFPKVRFEMQMPEMEAPPMQMEAPPMPQRQQRPQRPHHKKGNQGKHHEHKIFFNGSPDQCEGK